MKTQFSIICLFSILFMTTSSFSQKPIEEYGTFYKYLGYAKMKLTFDKGAFRYDISIDDYMFGSSQGHILGNYEQKGAIIKFTPTYYYRKGFKNEITEKTENITEFEDEYEICDVDSAILLLKLEDVFRKEYPAMWSENEYMFLISDINERESAWFARMWSTVELSERFLLDGNFKQYVPERWKEYFLKKPVEATIIDTLKLEKSIGTSIHYLITLNKGKIDGLRYGMRLFSGNAQIRIVDVKERTCQGYLHYQPYLTEELLKSSPIFSTQNKKLLKK